ncbi:MAG: S9 family peptidase [Steroidobacteraceae bacterium]
MKNAHLPLLLCLAAGAAGAAAAPPFTALDLVTLQRVSDPQVSPDGKRVVYVLRSTDLTANKGRKDLWTLDTGHRGAKPLQLTADPADDQAPQWSADGSAVFFLSNRNGSSQVWRVPAAGGAAIQVTQSPVDIGSFRLAPSGAKLVVSAEVFPDCADLACTAARLKTRQSHAASGQLHDHLFVRHWDSWDTGLRSQLFAMPLDASGAAAGPVVALTRGLDGDVPGKPFGGREDYAISPDGANVVFSVRIAPRTESWSTNFDLYAVPITGGTPRNLTASNPAADLRPAFSPDGTQLAYLAAERPGYEADRQRLALLDWKSGTSRVLTGNWDRSIESLAWSPDGHSLFVQAEHLGQKPLWMVDVASGRASAITGAGTTADFSVGKDRIIFVAGDLASPPDLQSVAFTGGRATVLTRIAADLRTARRLGEAEQFSFSGAKGDTVYAYLVKPAGFRASQQYPLAVLIHGGPEGSMANEWHWRWNAQSFAGAGYAALMIDFHGSTGYGQAFTDAINQDWGGKPLEDIQKGLAAALARYRWIDGTRACALGGSYGGYMVNWIAGQMPERFRCLVSHAGLFDNRSMYYSTEELWFPEWEFGGPEFLNPAGYARYNPVDHVKDWKTPTLVIHGQLDFRVPYAQGLSTYTALQRRGIPSELLVFPDENHWILKPANSMQWYEVVLDWLNRWTSRTPPSKSGG